MKITSSGALRSVRFSVEIPQTDLAGLEKENWRKVVEYLKAARRSQGSEALTWLRKAVAVLEQEQRYRKPVPRKRFFFWRKKADKSDLPPVELRDLGGIESRESFGSS